VSLDNVNTNEMLDRIGKYINGTYNGTAPSGGNNTKSGTKVIHKRDVFSYELQYSEISELKGQGQARGRSVQGQGRHRRTETADDKERGDRVLIRRKRASTSADGTPLFESKTAQKLAHISHYLHYASVALLSVLLIEVRI
jgi:hypothetical protein